MDTEDKDNEKKEPIRKSTRFFPASRCPCLREGGTAEPCITSAEAMPEEFENAPPPRDSRPPSSCSSPGLLLPSPAAPSQQESCTNKHDVRDRRQKNSKNQTARWGTSRPEVLGQISISPEGITTSRPPPLARDGGETGRGQERRRRGRRGAGASVGGLRGGVQEDDACTRREELHRRWLEERGREVLEEEEGDDDPSFDSSAMRRAVSPRPGRWLNWIGPGQRDCVRQLNCVKRPRLDPHDPEFAWS